MISGLLGGFKTKVELNLVDLLPEWGPHLEDQTFQGRQAPILLDHILAESIPACQ